jgi:hypothetical protein
MPLAEQLDPVTLALANAPVDDEPLTDADLHAVEQTLESIRAGKPLLTLQEYARQRKLDL